MKSFSIDLEVNWTYSKFVKAVGSAFYDIPEEEREEAMKKEFEKLTGKKVKRKEKEEGAE